MVSRDIKALSAADLVDVRPVVVGVKRSGGEVLVANDNKLARFEKMRDSRLLIAYLLRVLDHKQTESNEHEGFRISRYGADGIRIEDENGESIDIGSCFQNRDPSFYGSAVAYSPIVYMFENKILYRSGLLVSALNNEEIHLFDFTIYTAIFYKKNILLLNNEILCDVSNKNALPTLSDKTAKISLIWSRGAAW
jgi:hypothetical protein